MSPNVGNFVHDLVEMAKAMEMLPQVQADLEQANKLNSEQGTVIAAREESILKLKSEIDALQAKVREAEQGRDAAETMFLECDDKLSAFRRLAQTFSTDLGSLIQAQQPPAPMAVPSEEQVQGVSESKPMEGYPGNPLPGTFPDPIASPQGQSEADPTTAQPSTTTGTTTPVEPTASSEPQAGPFHGKLYINQPGWISREDWLAGGGNEATYDWREGMRLPDGFYYTNDGIVFGTAPDEVKRYY